MTVMVPPCASREIGLGLLSVRLAQDKGFGACVTVMDWPIAETVAYRGNWVGFGAADQLKVPLPLPPPDTVNQLALLEGVQLVAQPSGLAVTVIVPWSPSAEIVPRGMSPLMLKLVQSIPRACVTTMEALPAVTVADRESVERFSVADQLKDPLPLPLPDTVSQL